VTAQGGLFLEWNWICLFLAILLLTTSFCSILFFLLPTISNTKKLSEVEMVQGLHQFRDKSFENVVIVSRSHYPLLKMQVLDYCCCENFKHFSICPLFLCNCWVMK